MGNSADNKLMIFLLLFPENRLWYFFQTVLLGDHLHEMSKPFFWEKWEKIFQNNVCCNFPNKLRVKTKTWVCFTSASVPTDSWYPIWYQCLNKNGNFFKAERIKGKICIKQILCTHIYTQIPELREVPILTDCLRMRPLALPAVPPPSEHPEFFWILEYYKNAA